MMQTEEEAGQGWSGGGVSLVPEQPMRKWRLSFEGRMRNEKTGSVHNVKISSVYTSELPYFDFDSEMEAWKIVQISFISILGPRHGR